MPVYRKTLSWSEVILGELEVFTLNLDIHPFQNGVVVINYPGAEGVSEGYEQKYTKTANYIVTNKIGSVVRLPNPYIPGSSWDKNLRKAISHIIDESRAICGAPSPTLYLMGFSAGAAAIADIAWEYPQVKKILLMEPAPHHGDARINKTLKHFKGEICIVVGTGDEALGEAAGSVFLNAASGAVRKEIFVIPNCDHQFRGEKNGRIMSHAPIYSFSSDPKPIFPDENAGIKLYD